MHQNRDGVVEWGELYYDHYEKYLNSPVKREIFQQNESLPTIQVLIYENVFAGCKLFCTLGLSHYRATLNGVGEICMAADGGWDEIPSILANVSFFLVQQRKKLGWGIGVGGVGKAVSSFANQFGKDSIYLTKPFCFPQGFYQVGQDQHHIGKMYLALPISPQEYSYFLDFGAHAIEELLEDAEVDPFNLKRISAT